MQVSTQYLSVIVSHTTTSAIPGPAFPKAGVVTDIDPVVIGVVFIFAAALAIINIYTLWQHRLSWAQIKANRLYQILAQRNKQLAGWVVGFKSRLVKEFSWKVLFPAAILILISLKPLWAVWTGLISTLGMLLWITRQAVHELFHPRSTFNRSYLMFDKHPSFVRMRSIFEVGRKTFYFVIGFALISYGIHRIDPDAFSSYDGKRPLFLTHVESSLSSLAPTRDPLLSGDILGTLFRIVRTMFMFTLVITSIGILRSRFSPLDFDKRAKRKRNTAVKIHVHEINSHQDVVKLVLDLASACFEYPRLIAPKSTLKHDLRATKMEMAEFQQALEQAFELELLESQALESRMTLADLADFIWMRLERDRLGPEFPQFIKNAG